MPALALLPFLGTGETMILLLLGVLLFGKRLPEVGQYIGKTLVDLKKSFQGLQDGVTGSFDQFTRRQPAVDPEPGVVPARLFRRLEPTAPKFEIEPEGGRNGSVEHSEAEEGQQLSRIGTGG
jgi:sec-independent protein translocase protein TatA